MDCLPDDRSASSVLGVVLLVAVVVVVSLVVVVFGFAFLDGFGTPTAEASFRYDQTPAGLVMTPKALSTDVTVQLNGKPVETLSADSAGESVLLPTAPGDQITVISADGEQSVLVQREVDDRKEVGDFIAYYSFDRGSGDTVVDRSGNGNDGTADGGYSRTGSCMDFDGTSGSHVDIGDLTLDGPDSVDELTVAITYQHDGTGSGIQNLIEHQDSRFAWYIETPRDRGGDPHQMKFNIGWTDPPIAEISTPDTPAQETQVLVGTYDGEQMALYRNGEQIDRKALDREVQLGQVILAADSNPSIQNLDGQLCEVRLYYTAFDERSVDVLTNAMDE
jgi:FlaG/FlaF family flagellin (archaellin)